LLDCRAHLRFPRAISFDSYFGRFRLMAAGASTFIAVWVAASLMPVKQSSCAALLIGVGLMPPRRWYYEGATFGMPRLKRADFFDCFSLFLPRLSAAFRVTITSAADFHAHSLSLIDFDGRMLHWFFGSSRFAFAASTGLRYIALFDAEQLPRFIWFSLGFRYRLIRSMPPSRAFQERASICLFRSLLAYFDTLT